MAPEGRLADRALVLTVATFILLTPPIVAIFDLPVAIYGLPLLHVACFAVWLLAIALGGLLAARMVERPDESRDGDSRAGPTGDG